jgi:hypothetical protein
VSLESHQERALSDLGDRRGTFKPQRKKLKDHLLFFDEVGLFGNGHGEDLTLLDAQ